MPENAIKYGGPIDAIGPVGVLTGKICRLIGYSREPASASAELGE